MSRASILSGQVFGLVDWVTSDGSEMGMFLKTSERQTRCVLHGPEVKRLLANGVVKKGQEITASGLFAARCITHQDGSSLAEVICSARDIVAEPSMGRRTRGALYANLKGVAMYWDPVKLQLKTFFNYSEPGMPERMTCSIHLKHWVAGMRPESQEAFKAALRKGREFTLSANVETDFYQESSGLQVPVLRLLPTDFRLQG